ncbi:MAG: hypothetical protein QM772_01990 [Ottowia sp.]|uniref:hypothetical protein n=1 Tax=Ottowia sp. TaxID=1898956 RepID=UPI0039E59070
MKDFLKRQFLLIRKDISDYLGGKIDLNKFIGNLEAVSEIIQDKKWKEVVFPIILGLEQINAGSIEFGDFLTEHDEILIRESMRALDIEVERFLQQIPDS